MKIFCDRIMIRDQLFHQDGPSDPRDSQPLVDPGDDNEA